MDVEPGSKLPDQTTLYSLYLTSHGKFESYPAMFKKETITTIQKSSFFQQGNPKCVAMESHIHACGL